MKKHYATSSVCGAWRSVFGFSRLGDVIKVFLVIFFMAGYQCLLPVSFAVAVSDASDTSAEEQDDESEESDEDEDDGDEENDEGDENDDEKNAEEEEDGDDEKDDANESDANEQTDQVAGDEGGEEEVSDDQTEVTDVSQEDVSSDEISSDTTSQENDESTPSEIPSLLQEAVNTENVDDGDVSVDDVLEEGACDENCPEVQIVNVNDAEVVTDINTHADTGNNVSSENGEEAIQTCDENLSDVACNDDAEDDVCTDSNMEQELENEESGGIEDCSPIESTEGALEDGGEEGVETIEQGDETEENTLSDTENADEEQEVAADIATGDVVNIVNILQQVNTNIVGTNWTQLIYDIRGVYDADIDLFSQFEELLKNADTAAISQILDIYNHNTATVTNTITTSANTGDNSAKGNAGDVSIETGDAISGVNIVNLVNQNLIGNNWLFAVINVFGQWNGDLIVPGEGLLNGGTTQMNDVNVTNENSAHIDDVVTTSANTGDNSANGNAGDVSIETGDATSVTHVTEIVNTNIVANNWFFLMINNMGTWTGNILRWNSENNVYTTVFQYLFDHPYADAGEVCDDCSTINIHNDNTATVSNSVSVQADTGNNTADGNGGSAGITTGDAIAWANIFNMVNTNIVGNNWMFSIVNVMNEWSGDVVFAHPDLAITIDDARDAVTVGDEIHYTVSYQNIGEAAAESVLVTVSLPSDVRYHGDGSVSGDSLAFDIGKVMPGAEGDITLVATLNEDIDPEGVTLRSSAQITTTTVEVDMENNSASDHTSAIHDLSDDNMGGYDQYYYEWDIDPELTLKRTSNIVGPVNAGDLIVHQIVVENTGDSPVYDIVLTEEIESVDGSQSMTYEWDAGYLLEGESAIIDYAVIVSGGMASSDYLFSASAEGTDDVDDDVESNDESVMMTIAPYVSPIAIQDDDNDLPDLVPEAHAYSINSVQNSPKDVDDPAFWVWLIVLSLYALVINWTLFPQRRRL